MLPILFFHRESGELDRTLAASIAAQLQRAISERGAASLVVSGGRSPIGLFEALSLQALDWPRVTVTLADERWVDAVDADSNERLVRRHLLINGAAEARFLPLKNDAATPEEGSVAANAALADLPRPFDALVLGMGDDAHTASLFPGAATLDQALSTTSSCIAVRPPRAPHPRLSLSRNALLDARSIYVLITGDAKLSVIEQALEPGPIASMPIRAILHQARVPVEIHWCP